MVARLIYIEFTGEMLTDSTRQQIISYFNSKINRQLILGAIFDYFKTKGVYWTLFFAAVLIGGLFSTILVCLDGLKKDMLNGFAKSKVLAGFLAVFVPLIFGFLPFNFFINVVYPLIGIINFVVLIFL